MSRGLVAAWSRPRIKRRRFACWVWIPDLSPRVKNRSRPLWRKPLIDTDQSVTYVVTRYNPCGSGRSTSERSFSEATSPSGSPQARLPHGHLRHPVGEAGSGGSRIKRSRPRWRFAWYSVLAPLAVDLSASPPRSRGRNDGLAPVHLSHEPSRRGGVRQARMQQPWKAGPEHRGLRLICDKLRSTATVPMHRLQGNRQHKHGDRVLRSSLATS